LYTRFGIALPEWQQGLALCMKDEALIAAS
jgi:hypothetical protein